MLILTKTQKALLRELARNGLIPYTEKSASKLALTGKWGCKGAMAIHSASEGKIPCWMLRPDIWKAPKKESLGE